jgi:hypothetical protein
MGDSGQCAGGPASRRAAAPARARPGEHIPSSSARSGRMPATSCGERSDSRGSPARPPIPTSCPSSRLFRGACERPGEFPHVVDELGKWAPRRGGASHHDHFDITRHIRAHVPIGFPDPAPYAVTVHRAPHVPAHRESHSACRGPPPEDDKARALESATVLEDRLELRRPPEALASRQRERRRGCGHRAELDRQALAPLGAPALQDLSPALRLHPRAKSVRLLPSAHVGLKRPLHRENSLRGGRTNVVYGPAPDKSRRARPLRRSATL